MLRQAAKKPLALLLAFVMVVSTVFTVAPATVSSAEEVSRTNITSLNFASTADVTTNTIAFPASLPYKDGASGVTIDSSSPDKYGVNSASANTLKATGWGEGDYWSFLFHPVGYENYTISFYSRSSNTGVRDFKVQYSLDGDTWTDIDGATYQVTNSYTTQQSFALPSDLGNVSDLYIRMIVTSGICAAAGTGSNAVDKPAASSGVTNIGSITLSGTMVEGYVPMVVQPVTASIPSESVVDPDTEISLYSESVTASGAAIMMNVNGAEYDTMYTGPFTLASLGADEEHTEFTIATYAQVDETKSTYSTYTYYTQAMETIAISEAREKEDGTNRIQVEGIVNFVDGKNIYIEDSTAGIDLYFNTAPSDLAVGDKVVASGTKATSKGLEELTDVNYTVESHENALYSTNVTIAELLANPNTYECRRVHIEDAILGAINTTGNTTLTQDANTTNIYRIPALTGIEANATVKLDAVVGFYNTLQLRVVQASDVIKTADAPVVPDGGDDKTDDLTGVVDPVTDEMLTETSAKSLKDVYSATKGETITVLGQVAYQYGNVYSNANSINTIVLQDVIDNQIQGLAIYDYTNTYKTGDVIKVTGTVSENGGVRQISNVTAVETIGTMTLFKPQERTIQQLLEGGDQYLSEYVLIKNVTLGAYNSSGATTITDATGTTTLYKGALLPDGVAEGSVVNLYCAWSKYNTSYQVRNGATTDYVSMNADGSTVDTSIVLPIANWAGTSNIVGATTVLYGDKYTANDQLDLDSSLTVSTGVAPIITTTGGTGTNYYLGSKGLTEGNYYELQCDSELLGNVKLSYTMKGTKTSAKNFKILYSVDGETFTNVGTKSISAASTAEKFEVTLPNEANNATKLWVRIQVADNVSIGNETIGSGNNYLSEVALTGSPLVADTITGYPVITPESGEVQFGQEISISTATEGATIYYSFDGVNYVEYNDASKPVITELPGVITAYAKKAGLTDSLVIKNEYTQVQVAPVKANPNGGARTIGTKVKLTTATEGATIRYSLDNGTTWLNYNPEAQISLDVLPMTIVTKAVLDGCKDSETTTCSYTLRENENYNIYFGQIHSHTDYSDGAGTCDQAFNYAKNTAEQIDFLAVTDHSNSFDNEKTASLADGSVSEEWKEGHQLADDYTDASFVGIYGYEMTWSNGLGHMNTFNTNGFQSRTQADYSQYSTALKNYYTTLKTDTSSISQFNHPGTTFGDFSDFAHYDEEIDSLITLLEVGNGEGAIGSDGYFPSYEYYTRALDKGWHVAPTNNQDNHKGYWGDANTGRTVILADSLTRDNIYDALRNMRTYATEDNDLEVQYTLNGEVMGTVLEDTPAEADIKVQLKDPTDSSIGKVEVIVNGGLSVASENVTSNTANLEFNLPADYSYYYIRITQPDKDTAVTAPVWVGKVEAVGISSISTTAALTVKGEALDVNLE